MKLIVWFLLVLLLIPLVTLAQKATSTPLPAPSETAAPYVPLPTPTATSTPIATSPRLSDLQPITLDNLSNLNLLARLTCNQNEIRDVVWSPVRRQVALVAFSAICLYDLDMPDQVPLVLSPSDTWAAVFNADGSTLATLHNGSKSVRLWDVASGDEQTTSLRASYIYAGEPPTLAYSLDGKYIAAVFGGNLRLYDTADKTVLVRIRGAYQWGVAFSPDSKHLVTVEREQIKLWSLHPGPLLYQEAAFPIERSGCIMQFCKMADFGGSDGNIIGFPAGTDEIILYDLSQNERLGTVFSPGFLFLPDGRLQTVARKGETIDAPIYRTRYGVFSADGMLFAGVGADGNVELYGVSA